MIDPNIVNEIISAWNEDQEHPQRAREKIEIPSADIVRQFVEASFFASIKQEEGQPLNFSAVLASEAETARREQYKNSTRIFDEPIPFTPSKIAKMAPAFDPRLSSLLVAANAEGRLDIWGVFLFAPSKHYFNELPVGVMGAPSMQPDFFTVSTIAPGSLLFSRGYSAIGRITSGYFVRATPTPFTSKSLGKYLIEWTKSAPEWGMFRNAIEVLLAEIGRRGHGGTVVVLNPAAAPPTGPYRATHAFTATQDLKQFFARCSSNIGIHIDIAYRKIVFEALQRIAQLATIDGALILDSNFNVLAFGAKLTASPWTRKTLVGPDSYGTQNGQPFETDRYGTRHQSARDFAGVCGQTVVFVISQDGPVRAFHQTDSETVTVWPDCTTSMFVS